MRGVSKSEARKIVEMAARPGWAVFIDVLQSEIMVRQRALEETEFETLAEVACLQGQITILREVLEYPKRREAQLLKEA